MRLRIWLILFFFLSAFGQSGDPTAPLSFILPTARTIGLGGGGALSDDVGNLNPGSLSFQKSFHSLATYFYPLPGFYPGPYYGFLTFSYPLPKGGVGVSLTYFNFGEVEVINNRGEYIGSYFPYDFIFTLSFGHPLSSPLGLGLNLKFIYSFLYPKWLFTALPPEYKMDGGDAITGNFDLGVFYQPFRQLNFGLVLLNFGPDFKYFPDDERRTFIKMLKGAVSYSPLCFRNIEILAHSEFSSSIFPYPWCDHSFFGEETVKMAYVGRKSIGVEVTGFRFLTLRVSYLSDSYPIPEEWTDYERRVWGILEMLPFKRKFTLIKRSGLSFGFGISWRGLRLDFSSDQKVYPFSNQSWAISLSYRIIPLRL